MAASSWPSRTSRRNDNIIGQFVNPDGTLSGSNIDIEIDAGYQFDPAVAQRAGGAAVVVWEDDAASDEIHYSIVSAPVSVGAEQTILDGGPICRPGCSDARRRPFAGGCRPVQRQRMTSSSASSMRPGRPVAVQDSSITAPAINSIRRSPPSATTRWSSTRTTRPEPGSPGALLRWHQLRRRGHDCRCDGDMFQPGRGGPDRRPLHRRLGRRSDR